MKFFSEYLDSGIYKASYTIFEPSYKYIWRTPLKDSTKLTYKPLRNPFNPLCW